MRNPQVIAVWHHSIRGRESIDGAPVWGWSGSDRPSNAAAGPTVCGNAVAGDYIVWHDTYCEDGDTPRARPWSVVKAWARRGGGVEVAIGCGAISHHRTIEAAIKAAAAMLRAENNDRAAAARAACQAGEPADCPDAHTCRHGIDG
jgi:hypothetical protein